MNLDLLKNADAAELRSYIEFLLWHYRVADGFWFIYTNEKFDRATDRGDQRAGMGQGRRNGC